MNCECGSMSTVLVEDKDGYVEPMCDKCYRKYKDTAEQALPIASGEGDAEASFKALNGGEE